MWKYYSQQSGMSDGGRKKYYASLVQVEFWTNHHFKILIIN